MNISSIVIRTSPQHEEDLVRALNTSGLCEVHFHDKQGKIIVTIEGENSGVEVQKMTAIQAMDNVLAAEMIFSHNEEELEYAREFLEKNEEPVPSVLDEAHLDARHVKYGGHLKI